MTQRYAVDSTHGDELVKDVSECFMILTSIIVGFFHEHY